jgi:enamine deaminase RidA (YjgF/YER057c/UK114 family)
VDYGHVNHSFTQSLNHSLLFLPVRREIDLSHWFQLFIFLNLSFISPETMMTPEERFARLGLELPPAPAPLGVYKPLLIDGRHCYVSGHGTVKPDKSLITGRIGEDLNPEEGKLAARQVGLAILSTLKTNLGSLNKVKRVIKVLGMVNCTPGFEKHPFIINGCSELFAAVWGEEQGVGVRSAVGMGSLPDNIPVEIEALFELHPD